MRSYVYEYRTVENTKEEILDKIGHGMKIISQAEKEALENPINMNELSECLGRTRNNISLGASGFSGSFYKMFWDLLKYIVLAAIHQIFEDKHLPISQRLGIICLIPKGDKHKKYLTNW